MLISVHNGTGVISNYVLSFQKLVLNTKIFSIDWSNNIKYVSDYYYSYKTIFHFFGPKNQKRQNGTDYCS